MFRLHFTSLASRAALALAGCAVLLTHPVARADQAPPDILTFYQTALAMARATQARDLSVACRETLPDALFEKKGEMHVSFVSGSDKKIILAVFTKNAFPDTSAIDLDQNRNGLEWMFVFDRNRDGKIDYIMWPQGFMPYIDGTPPAGFPVMSGSQVHTDRAGFALMQQYGRMIFEHWADDGFAGKVSAMILEAWDPNGLAAVTGYQLVRSSHADGVLDQCWYFSQNINNRTGACQAAGPGFKTRTAAGAGTSEDVTPDVMSRTSQWFSRLDEAAVSCGLTRDSFAL
jgi:hypothetical protein